ncbi:MAG: hypothetical protein R3A50_13680 [Saprospiraceae bacterium]
MWRKALQYGIKTGSRQWRVTGIVYFLQFCLALTIGMQVYEVLQASIGSSLEVNKLMSGYDHTVITDFLKVHGASVSPLIGQMRWILLVWLLFSVFINGGLLYCADNPEEAKASVFWKTGAWLFFPYLKIALLFLAFAALLVAAFFLPLAAAFQPAIQYFPSEVYFVWICFLSIFLVFLGLAKLFIMSVLSRFHYLRNRDSVFKSVLYAFKQFRRNWKRYLGVMLVFGVMQLFLLGVYMFIEAFTGMRSPLLILFVFLIQQAFAFVRVLVRQMMYTSLAHLSRETA